MILVDSVDELRVLHRSLMVARFGKVLRRLATADQIEDPPVSLRVTPFLARGSLRERLALQVRERARVPHVTGIYRRRSQSHVGSAHRDLVELWRTMEKCGPQLPTAARAGQGARAGSAAKAEAVEKEARVLVKRSDSQQPNGTCAFDQTVLAIRLQPPRRSTFSTTLRDDGLLGRCS